MTHLICSQCSCSFVATKSQWNHRHERPITYCSSSCRSAARKARIKPPSRSPSPCPTCGEFFHSKTAKTFCGLDCYLKSEQIKKMQRSNMKKGHDTQKKASTDVTKPCLNCGIDMVGKKGRLAAKKYCSHLCYREYMEKRFDRWIASPEHISVPQNFDEFLLQEDLPCLIEGCSWRGNFLSLHLNQAHGISSEEFKRIAGFNLSSGIVSSTTAKNLSRRPKIGIALNPPIPKSTANTVRTYRSKESEEHAKKALHLRKKELEENPYVRICLECGNDFTTESLTGRAFYCSVECRNSFYRKNRS